jgi:hypothetical protein
MAAAQRNVAIRSAKVAPARGTKASTGKKRNFRGAKGDTRPTIVVEIADLQTELPLDEELLCEAVRAALEDLSLEKGRVSVAVVDDPTISRLNEQFLGHKGPADVLSFPLERSEGWLEG